MPQTVRPARVFWTAVTAIAVEATLFTMVVPALAVFADELSLGRVGAAAVFGAFPVAQLVTALAGVGLVERLGRRRSMAVAGVVLVVAGLAFAFAGTVAGLLAARVLQGAGAGLAWTTAIASLCDVYPGSELGFRLGLAQTAAGASGLAGPLLGGVLIDAFGVRTAFTVAAALPLLPLLMAVTGPETGRGATAARPLAALRLVGADPRARGATLALTLSAASLALLEPLVPIDLADRLDLGPTGIGIVFGALLLAFFAVAPVAGRMVDRRGSRTMVIGGALAVAVALPGIGLLPAAGVGVCLALAGAGQSMLAAPAGPELARAVDAAMPGAYAVAAGWLMIAWSTGYVCGPYAGAALSAVLPFPGVLAVAAAAIVLAAWRAVALLPGTPAVEVRA